MRTYEDYDKIINDFLSNTDDLSKIDDIKNYLKEDLTALSEATTNNNALSDKVAELRDLNLQLFLKTGSETAKEDNPTEEVPEKTLDELFKEDYGHLF